MLLDLAGWLASLTDVLATTCCAKQRETEALKAVSPLMACDLVWPWAVVWFAVALLNTILCQDAVRLNTGIMTLRHASKFNLIRLEGPVALPFLRAHACAIDIWIVFDVGSACLDSDRRMERIKPEGSVPRGV